MTTIAWRSGVLAADTLIAYSTYTNGHRNKIARCGDYYVGLAGPVWIKQVFEPWVSEGADPNNVPQGILDSEDEFRVLLMDDFGRAFEYDRGYLLPVDAEYHAIGSGGYFALGAMAHGATAEEAVAAGIKHDKSSGGDITRTVATFPHDDPMSGRVPHLLPN